MNILVTGANGQLGNEIQLVSKQSKDHYIFTDVCEGYTKLDITNLEDIRKMVQDNKIDVSSTALRGPMWTKQRRRVRLLNYSMQLHQRTLQRL